MTGMTNAFNLGAINGDAFSSSRMGFALGITLQPGETINMLHTVSYSTSAEISSEAVQVSEPGSMALVTAMLFGLGLTRRRQKK